MPMERERYPKDWERIAFDVKSKAEWKQIGNQTAQCTGCGWATNAKLAKGFRFCPNCEAKIENGPTQSNDSKALDALEGGNDGT